MKKIKKVGIITTRQNYKWTSMQEVLPGIERCWEDAFADLKIEYKKINADVDPIRSYAKHIIQCDVFVIIAFNETISRVMQEIRLNLNPSANFIFHLYGHATLGMWPEARFGVLNLMTASDVFIGTCDGDKVCMNLTSSNAQTYIVPYPYFPLSLKSLGNQKVFTFVGRISDQKNIHILVQAYKLLLDKNSDIPLLFIYGKEDFLGHPNMGIKSNECLHELKSLIHNLKLENKILFKGFCTKDEIYSELSSDHIFLSASTHSDENFGMALMASLSLGGLAVVTSWGGHNVFKKHCPERVWTASVQVNGKKPEVNVQEFSLAMESAWNKLLIGDRKKSQLPDYFSAKSVTNTFKKILYEIKSSATPLELSLAAKKLHMQQKNFEELGNIQQAFYSYEDPLAQIYLNAYSKDN